MFGYGMQLNRNNGTLVSAERKIFGNDYDERNYEEKERKKEGNGAFFDGEEAITIFGTKDYENNC